MKQSELLEIVAAKAGFSQHVTARVLDTFASVTKTALGQGATVNLVGFGKFEPKERAARTGRNPQTGESIDVPAKTVVTFKPSKAMKDAVGG